MKRLAPIRRHLSQAICIFSIVATLLCAPAICDAANLLFVIRNSTPTSAEQLYEDQFEAWGYTVTTIDDSDSQANYDAALASADVVYVSEVVLSTQVAFKLRTTTVGVVSSEAWLDSYLGFSNNYPTTSAQTQILVTDNTHDVSRGLATGVIPIFSSTENRVLMDGAEASGMQVLATSAAGDTVLAVLEPGASLATSYGSNHTASGRRVRLPWGNITFDFNSLNSTGLELLERSLVWAAGGEWGLVAHWKLDETSGSIATDSSIQGNDGTVSGSAGWSNEGVRGGAIDVGPTDVIDCGTFSVGTSELTLAAWVKPDTLIHEGRLLMKSSGNTASTQSWGITIDDSGDADFRVKAGGNWHRIIASGVIVADKWQHIMGVYDGTDMRLYVNSEIVATTTHPNGGAMTEGSTHSVTIGDSPVGNREVDGKIDDVRVYNYALTDEEIAEVYGLIGHWKFDEGSGSTAADDSGKGNDASFNTGSPNWVSGIRGNALEFDGTNDAQTAMEFDPPSTGAIAFWMRSDGPPSGRQRPWGLGSDYEMWQDTDGLVSMDVSTDGYQGGFITTTPLYDPSTWYHIVAQYDSDTDSYEIYINGQLHKSGISTWDIIGQASNNLSFGTRTGSTEHFSGALDDFRVYNRWLIEEEIAQLYGLVGHWKLDESSGSIATDSSGAGQHGTYTGGVILNASGPKTGLSAAEFDGSNGHVALPTYGEGFGEGFAMAVWAKPTLNASWVRFLELGNGEFTDNMLFARYGGSSDAILELHDGSLGSRAILAPNSMSSGTWRHYAVSVDSFGEATFYVNGVSVNTETIGVPNDVSRVVNNIAKSNWSHDSHYGGHLHDVRLYNRPMTESEVEAAYQGGETSGLRIISWTETQ